MRILISGAGIAGLSLALRLEATGHEPVVVERSPGPRAEGYMIDFFGSGYDAAERMGLLGELAAIHYPVGEIAFAGGDGRTRVRLSYPEVRRLFDDRHYNFMRGDLERVLAGRVAGRVDVRYGSTVESFEDEGERVRVALEGGAAETFDLLVGADGIRSNVRRLAFAGADPVRYLGYHTAAFVLPPPFPAAVDERAFSMLSAPGRQVGLYPIRGPRLATFFVHPSAERFRAPSDEEGWRRLRDVYGSMDRIVPELLGRTAEATGLYYDEVSQVEMPAWSRGRVVLVGDACGCVSLLAGQGASLAMAGAWILAEELERSPADVPAALARYEARLRPAIAAKQKAGRRVARWFVPANRWTLWLRDLGLRAATWPPARFLLKRGLDTRSVLDA